ncbi:MAG: helicase/exodeoxyribonuclease beta subunit [Verrucomicrobiota bacterium]
MTPEPFQLEATPLESGVTLLEASAGTGKTFAIAGLFLRMVVEAGIEVSQILVVTFTEAATAELRGRIRERLSEARRILRAGETGDPLWQRLLLEGTVEERGGRLKRVEVALEQFDSAAVFTIHGFCRRVLRECAFETGALFDAELQPDVEALVQEASDNFWRRQFYEAPAHRLLMAQAAGLSADSMSRLLRRHLQQSEPLLLPVAEGRSLESVWEAAEAAFAATAALWSRERSVIVAPFGDTGGRWANLPYKSSRVMDPCFIALDALFAGSGTAAGLAAVADLTPEALSSKVSKRAKLPVPTHPFFDACAELVTALSPVAAALRYALLTSAPRELAQLKDRDRTLGFDDLLRQVAEAVRGPRGGGLADRLQAQYRAALIDEFQDTDPLQWSIFQRLFTGNDIQLYLVGDPKQAIYSFRGADVFAYLRARGVSQRRFTLGENWRSARGLVDAVNRVFGEHPLPFALEAIQFHPVRAAGRADENPLVESGGPKAPLQLWFWDSAADGIGNEPARMTRLAESTAAEIVRLLSGNTRLGDRRLAPGDIAVLVDTHVQAEAVATELALRRVPCVRQTQISVFATREADDLQMLLDALSEGADEAQRRAALVTDLVGVGAADLAAQRDAEGQAGWDIWRERLSFWRDRWLRHGVLPMLETVLRSQDTRARLLSTADGERRLTNYLHLGELLQQTSTAERLAPRSLASWLAEHRARAAEDPRGAEETLLRLERDAAAVQLVTIHRSKGLEYPVVFCPFPGRAFDQGLKERGRNACETVLFHDPLENDVLKHDVGTPQFETHRARAEGEALAENLRLLYVALTRAKHRCYLGWSVGSDPARRALSWLLCPVPEIRGLALEKAPEALVALVGSLGTDSLRSAAERWSGSEIAVVDLPPGSMTRWVPADAFEELDAARVFRGAIQRDWGSASFSSLAQGSSDASAELDPVGEIASPLVENPLAVGPLAEFRGTRAGVCLHEVFEQLDHPNADGATLLARVEERLQANGYPSATLAAPLAELVGCVLDAPLFAGRPLRRVPMESCWWELEFLLPLRPISPGVLSAAFAAGPPGAKGTALASSLARLEFADIRGVLGGFMDLVLQSGGQWWLVDWKSNWLGDTPDAYGADALEREMISHHYGLQYHLYLLALHRLLRMRFPSYDYERDFGGVRYVFVRGVTPGRPDLGVFEDRPPLALLEALEQHLLEGAR